MVHSTAPVSQRLERRLCVSPDATAVVRELLLVLLELAVEFDNIGVLVGRNDVKASCRQGYAGGSHPLPKLVGRSVDANHKVSAQLRRISSRGCVEFGGGYSWVLVCRGML